MMPATVRVIVPDEPEPISLPIEAYAAANRDTLAETGRSLRPASRQDAEALAAFGAGDVEPEAPGWGESVARGLGRGATFGFMDEGAGVVGAAIDKAQGDPRGFGELYTENRDRVRADNAAAEGANPNLSIVGMGVGAVPSSVAAAGATAGARGLAAGGKALRQVGPLLGPAVGAAPASLKSILAPILLGGAGYGAVQGLGDTEATTTGGVLKDVGGTAATTALLGPVAHGVVTAGAPLVGRAARALTTLATPYGPVKVGPLEKLSQMPQARAQATNAATVAGGLGGAVAIDNAGAMHPLLGSALEAAGAAGPLGGAGAGGAYARRTANRAFDALDRSVQRKIAPLAENAAYWERVAAENAIEDAAMARANELHDPRWQNPPEITNPRLSFEPEPYHTPPRGRRTSDFPVDVMAGRPAPEPPPLELMRDPTRRYASTPTASPPQPPLDDAPLIHTARAIEAELGLGGAPLRAPAPVVEPMATPTEARGPALTPSGGEIPKGPGVDMARGAKALQAERMPEWKGRPDSPTPPEPAGAGGKASSRRVDDWNEETPANPLERLLLAAEEEAAFKGAPPNPRRKAVPSAEGETIPKDVEPYRHDALEDPQMLDRETKERLYPPLEKYDPTSPQSIKTDHRKHVEEKYEKRKAYEELIRETLGADPGEPVWPFAPRDTLNQPGALEPRPRTEAPPRAPLESLMEADSPIRPPEGMTEEIAASARARRDLGGFGSTSPERIGETVHRLREYGQTPEQIAKALGIDVSLVKRALLQGPTPLQTFADMPPIPRGPQTPTERVIAARRLGKTPEQIAKALRMRVGEVRAIIQRDVWTRKLRGDLGAPEAGVAANKGDVPIGEANQAAADKASHETVRMLRLREEGYTDADIADATGMALDDVERELEILSAHAPEGASRLLKIREMSLKGVSARDIAYEMGIGTREVERVQFLLDVEPPAPPKGK